MPTSVVHQQSQSIVVKNGRVEALSQDENQGLGIRVLINGAWAFASTSNLTAERRATHRQARSSRSLVPVL